MSSMCDVHARKRSIFQKSRWYPWSMTRDHIDLLFISLENLVKLCCIVEACVTTVSGWIQTQQWATCQVWRIVVDFLSTFKVVMQHYHATSFFFAHCSRSHIKSLLCRTFFNFQHTRSPQLVQIKQSIPSTRNAVVFDPPAHSAMCPLHFCTAREKFHLLCGPE